MKSFKEILPAIIVSVVTSFMLFIYEPICMYANNVDEFWFDIYKMLPLLFPVFFVSFIFMALIFFVFYKGNRKIYYASLLCFFIVFFATYIQGNFLAGSLPSLQGEIIDWSKYNVDKIISVVLWILVTAVAAILVAKFKSKRAVKYFSYATLAVFVMLLVSLVTALATTPVLTSKEGGTVATTKNFNKYSTERNFFILLVDAVDSTAFTEVNGGKSDYATTFADFTYFKDALGGYPCTRNSIPFILSGKWNENTTDFFSYSTEAFNGSPFLSALDEHDYHVNFYNNDLIYYGDRDSQIENLITNARLKTGNFYEAMFRYIVFKYAPYSLKQTASMETVNFNEYTSDDNDAYAWKLSKNYEMFREDVETTGERVFQFIHTEGGHVPYDVDENMQPLDNGTYEQKIAATYETIKVFLERLRKSNLYDNSVVVVMADHGSTSYVNNRQNPLLMIKGVNERHGFMTSKKPISYADLAEAFQELLTDKTSNEIFVDIEYPRTRRYLDHHYLGENHLVEQETKSEAWKMNELKPTGVEYNR